MRSHVLGDARLAKQAGRFVWLEVDYEKPRNADFVGRYPVDAFPSFLVLDPATGEVVTRWIGSTDVPRLEAFLADARARLRGREGKPTVESRALDLYAEGDHARCAEVVREGAPRLPRGGSFANAVATGLACALELEEGPARAEAVAALEPLAREALALPRLLADDRSALHAAVVGARELAGDEAGAREAAERWWAFLEEEAARSRTAERRAFLDPARMNAASTLGDLARAVPALERSARELPDDYNPPARLAYLYRELGRLDEARAAADRAIALAYGPRKLRIFEVRASILEKLDDRDALVANLREAVAHGDALPAPQLHGRDAVAHGRMRKHLEQLEGKR